MDTSASKLQKDNCIRDMNDKLSRRRFIFGHSSQHFRCTRTYMAMAMPCLPEADDVQQLCAVFRRNYPDGYKT
jgi:hypothetical protein